MTADNRTVHTDALATLGTIIDDTQKRDAIHLAVLPMVAPVRLKTGALADAVAYLEPRVAGTGGKGDALLPSLAAALALYEGKQ